MPEQLTKHPEVTLQVLRSGGASCGAGAPQEILTGCPAERFCKLPGGEVCVYGLPEAARMTQLTAADWQSLQAVSVPRPPGGGDGAPDATLVGLAAGGLGLLVGAALAVVVRRVRGRRRP